MALRRHMALIHCTGSITYFDRGVTTTAILREIVNKSFFPATLKYTVVKLCRLVLSYDVERILLRRSLKQFTNLCQWKETFLLCLYRNISHSKIRFLYRTVNENGSVQNMAHNFVKRQNILKI